MRTYLHLFSIAALSFSLSACDGFEFDSVDGSTVEDSEFTDTELAFNVIFSSSILEDVNGDSREGFVALFNSTSEVNQIRLRFDDDDDEALDGNYTWDIDDEELVITTADGTMCTTTKTTDSTTEYNTDGDCDGSIENDVIDGEVFAVNPLDFEDLEGLSISLGDEDDDEDFQKLNFFSNGTFEVVDLDDDGDEVSGTTETGVYFNSLTLPGDAVRLNNASTAEYSILVLLDGSLSQGTMLELRFSDEINNTLEEVRIYDITASNQWDIDSLYDEITTDS